MNVSKQNESANGSAVRESHDLIGVGGADYVHHLIIYVVDQLLRAFPELPIPFEKTGNRFQNVRFRDRAQSSDIASIRIRGMETPNIRLRDVESQIVHVNIDR